MLLSRRSAVSRIAAVVIVVIMILAAAVGAYYLVQPGTSSGTSTSSTSSTSTGEPSTSSQQSSMSSVSSSSAGQSTTTSTSGVAGGVLPTYVPSTKSVESLSVDEWAWPIDDLNQLYALSELPWPNWLTFTVYQPLVSVNETAEYHTGVIQYLPGLAANWTLSADGTIYTFNLRNNVHFSDGDPFNAYQVWAEMYGFYYLSGNSTTWLESYDLFDMSPVTFGPSTIALMTQSGVTSPSSQLMTMMQNESWPIYVAGPYQIVFHLKSPFQWFPGTLVVYDGLIFDVQWLLQNGGFGTPSSYNGYFNQHPIPGTGPYMVTAAQQNGYVKFAQDPNYWGNSLSAAQIAAQPIFDPGHAKNVIVYYKPDNIARYADLENNVVQVSAVEASEWPLVTSNPSMSFLELPPWAGQVSLLALNALVYPTNITAVRQAITHAINYTEVYSKAYQGLMSPYVGPEYPAWSDYYDLGNFPPASYNATLAKQILTQAGVDTSRFPPLLYKVESGCEACANMAEVIQANLADVGLDVQIQIISIADFESVLGTYQDDVQNAQQIGALASVNSGFGWSPATLTPADYWVTFVSNGSLYGNYPAYYNPIVQKCVDAFTSTTNTTLIKTLCTAAQAQIQEDAPYAWMGTFKLWLPPGGSLVWNHNVVKGFMVDPVWNGQNTAPIFNTITFA